MTPASTRRIARIVRPDRHVHGPGLTTTDLVSANLDDALDPFLVVSLYDMAGPTFPPHPHAGFSVATYILPESPVGFVNHDTLGNRNLIAPGALHVTVAGSGVLHEEQPERTGSLARGFQIWIDHSNDARELTPYARHQRADQTPVVTRDGATVRAVLGASNGVAASVTPPTPVRIIDVDLRPGASFLQTLEEHEAAFLMLLDGSVSIVDRTVSAGEVAVLEREGGELLVVAGERGARLTLFAGRPLSQPKAQRGPFVGRDAAQLQRFGLAFQSGAFGDLRPFSAQPNWAPNDGQTLAD